MRNLMILFSLVFSTFTCFSQSDWTFIEETKIEGFTGTRIPKGFFFKTTTGDYFITNKKAKKEMPLQNPTVEVFKNGVSYKLKFKDSETPLFATKIENAIETQHKGTFKGLEDGAYFEMMNGQTWVQFSTRNRDIRLIEPKVVIYKLRRHWYMIVEGFNETIKVYLL